MPNNASPGVEIRERDLTLRIPSVTSSTGALVVASEKGPLNVLTLINDQKQYDDTFGIPNDTDYKHYFTASSFLAGSNQLYVVRTEDDTKKVAGITIGLSGSAVGAWPTQKTADQFPLAYDSIDDPEAVVGGNPVFDEEIYHVHAIGAGPYYDGVQVSVINSDDYEVLVSFKEELSQAVLTDEIQAIAKKYYTGTPVTTSDPIWDGGSIPPSSDPIFEDTGDYLANSLLRDDLIDTTDWSVDTQLLSEWTQLEIPPESDDEFVVLVYDVPNNSTTDARGELREIYMVSSVYDKKNEQGNVMFAPTVINSQSEFIYFFVGDTEVGASGATIVSTGLTRLDAGMTIGGADELTENLGDLTGEIEQQWRDKFTNKENLEIDILLDPDYPDVLKRTLDDIAKNIRKDCFALLNMPIDKLINEVTGVPLTNSISLQKTYVQGSGTGSVSTGSLNINSSYSAIYGNYFLIYDPYAEKERWVPATGYVGAVIARVDFNDAQWFAPAGLNRGIIDNVVRVAINPTKEQRDVMYTSRINPIVNFFGQGVVIWGQKTMQSKPSAFDRINVRRLFLHMEKSIEKMARYMLFELNDDFTRARFRGLVNPFLADIAARRGIYDYLVVCDETNNTAQIIDNNEFVAEILVKPARAIEFIKLTFTAVPTGVEFTEVVQRRA